MPRRTWTAQDLADKGYREVAERWGRSGVEGHATRMGKSAPGEAAMSMTRGQGEMKSCALGHPKPVSRPASSPFLRQITLVGQIPSGKNQMGVRRDGRHYPRKRFIDWRAEACNQIIFQKHANRWMMLLDPVCLSVQYWPGDHRTRDLPGMEDALFHLLVYAGILKNDGLIYNGHWYRMAVSTAPKVILELTDYEVQP